MGSSVLKEKIEDAEDLNDKGKIKVLLRNWFDASKTLVQLLVNHLPSPQAAQTYRVKELY